MQSPFVFWHWLIFGTILVVTEIFIPSFTIFWFGLAALMVGVILWLMPGMSVGLQLLLWGISSVALTIFWFRYFKPRMVDRTKAGISREAVIGESGQVIKVPEEGQRGTVRFAMPLLGSDEWPFICHQTVAIGDRVFVKEVSGNSLVVEKRGP